MNFKQKLANWFIYGDRAWKNIMMVFLMITLSVIVYHFNFSILEAIALSFGCSLFSLSFAEMIKEHD